jgi:hypothetical protein
MISKKSGFSLAVMAIGLAMLSACTPADIEYCSKFGVAGTAEYGKCLDYYQQQQAAFTADYNVCASEADITYPATLYDHGGFAHVGVGTGFGGRYHGGGYGYSGGLISVPPNYQHNAEVDRLRARIITPCMQARGWNSQYSWQAGRSEVKPAKRTSGRPIPAPAAPSEKLPWLN